MALGQRHDGAALRLGVRARGGLGLAAGHVHVEDGTAEQLVADRAADEVGLLPGRGQKRGVIHRRPSCTARCGGVRIPHVIS